MKWLCWVWRHDLKPVSGYDRTRTRKMQCRRCGMQCLDGMFAGWHRCP